MGLVNHTYHSSHISPPIIRTPLYPPPLGALPIVSLIRADWVTSWGTYTVPHPWAPHQMGMYRGGFPY